MAHTQFIKRTASILIYQNGDRIYRFKHYTKFQKMLHKVFYGIKIVEIRGQ